MLKELGKVQGAAPLNQESYWARHITHTKEPFIKSPRKGGKITLSKTKTYRVWEEGTLFPGRSRETVGAFGRGGVHKAPKTPYIIKKKKGRVLQPVAG